jgi:hypothetical protein
MTRCGLKCRLFRPAERDAPPNARPFSPTPAPVDLDHLLRRSQASGDLLVDAAGDDVGHDLAFPRGQGDQPGIDRIQFGIEVAIAAVVPFSARAICRIFRCRAATMPRMNFCKVNMGPRSNFE